MAVLPLKYRPLRGCLVPLLLLWLSGCEQGSYQPPAAAWIPVRSEVVAETSFQPSLPLFGRIESAVEVELRAGEPGRIRYAPRFADGLRTGETVSRGERLFTVENDGVRLQRVEAELALRAAEAELDRARRSAEAGLVAHADLERAEIAAESAREQLESARRRSARLATTAPIAGLLRVPAVVPTGTEISPDLVLGKVASGGLPRIEAWAAADDLRHLVPGLEVRCLEASGREQVGSGRLREVARQVDTTGTARLVIEVTEDLDLPPVGEGVVLEVLLAMRPDAITLPVEALLIDGGAATAYVLETSGSAYKARRRLLLTGSRDGGRIEVIDGVSVGERVAVQGAEFLADGLLATEASTDSKDL